MRGTTIAVAVLGFGGGYLISNVLPSKAADAGAVLTANAVSEPIARLLEGNERYISGKMMHDHQSVSRRDEVAKGQKPFAVIVGCADSRVPPEIVFDQGLGDLFVVRCAGNVCEDASIGSIEYAVEHLGAKLIVVLGHERCGAVDAVLKGGELPGHLGSFATAIGSAARAAKSLGAADTLDAAVRLNVSHIVDQLSHCGPFLDEMVEKGEIQIVGARYDLDEGRVEFLNADSAETAHHGTDAHDAHGKAEPKEANAEHPAENHDHH